MENRYRVNITPQALRQMQEIKRYIKLTLQAPKSAQKWQKQIKEEIEALSSMPTRFPLIEEEPWHDRGIHKMVVKNHLVYFWIDDGNFRVWVIAVIYGRRDQREQLGELGIL